MPDFTFQTVVGGETFLVSVSADTQAEAAVLAANEFQPAFGDVTVTPVGSIPPDVAPAAPSVPDTPPPAPAAPTPDPAPAPDTASTDTGASAPAPGA